MLTGGGGTRGWTMIDGGSRAAGRESYVSGQGRGRRSLRLRNSEVIDAFAHGYRAAGLQIICRNIKSVGNDFRELYVMRHHNEAKAFWA